jgi:outer membrane protein OmpA-like peptidoglycan-associated protein
VAQYLLSRDVVPARIETVGFGESTPIADNSTEAGRSLNRRVELSLLPIAETS